MPKYTFISERGCVHCSKIDIKLELKAYVLLVVIGLCALYQVAKRCSKALNKLQARISAALFERSRIKVVITSFQIIGSISINSSGKVFFGVECGFLLKGQVL